MLAHMTFVSLNALWLGSGSVSGRIQLKLVNGNKLSGKKKRSTHIGRKRGCSAGSAKGRRGHQTYPKLLHFFFLEGGCHEQRSTEGKGWMSRERKRQSLGQERSPRSPKEKQISPKRPTWESKRGGNQMATPLRSDIIRQRHTFTGALCTFYANNVYRETVARGNSCQREQLLERKSVMQESLLNLCEPANPTESG